MFTKKQEKIAAAEEIRDLANNIGRGTLLKGDIETEGNVRIEGKLVGNIKCQAKVVIGVAEAHVDGNILAKNGEIHGQVDGVIYIEEMLVLRTGAKVNGEIYAKKLVIEAGAEFNGKCQMGEISQPKSLKVHEGSKKEIA
ncbi:bactofilin family protein [Aureibacter tunicatorum]|uniref:Cytoskeletal protein CcmA (Bactofilin family) n=1 Tax=Aureibacter tunicatorum TaxID=866807 RepID=A0AAE3XLL5_9BACT|nr:polymer-forming cytoskeletal protein [Aureibacter tunicatorum]MDR6237199.1 cytoskeletal protein CcmA (bactofilin family) [Aureibacter tunicatorum]BDD06191.1 hypothetical protein AUTU_36740 [Aureibacter tunicatorum]